MRKTGLSLLAGLSAAVLTLPALALDVPLAQAELSGPGKAVGTISVTATPYGVLFTPALTGLPPGLHGFHLHEKPSCAAGEKDGKTMAALGAGGHFDPAATSRHEGPYGNGHLGDLPPLYIDAQGNGTQPVLAPRLKLEQLKGHALMLHAGGDNHADHPEKLGGGGARIACGVIPS